MTPSRARSSGSASPRPASTVSSSPKSTTDSAPTPSTWSLRSNSSVGTQYPDRSSKRSPWRRRSWLPLHRNVSLLSPRVRWQPSQLPPRTPFALDADAVDLVLLAQDGAVSLGVPGEAKASVDLSRKLYAVSAGESLGSADFSAAFDMGALATAAQLQGLGQTLLEVTTEYAKQRKQFGKVIGQFQAMKHHLAEVAVSLEMARPLLHGRRTVGSRSVGRRLA